jgi:hypothetical protein
MEALEYRQVLSSVPITDMTAWSQQFPTHKGPTVLYLNFDGDSGTGTLAFTDYQNSGNTVQDIQEILFRTAEIFAPFNVEVERIYGNGSYDGSSNHNTTIFVGDNPSNLDLTQPAGKQNVVAASTPFRYTDYPWMGNYASKAPNSDPFDIAYVDPASNASGMMQTNSPAVIATAIAHEAGHTFGLAHTRAIGADPTALSPSSTNPPDLMDYDTPGGIASEFMNVTRAITDWNYEPSSTDTTKLRDGKGNVFEPSSQPVSRLDVPLPLGLSYPAPVNIVTQNAYSDLMALLGPRPADDNPNVVDTANGIGYLGKAAVDPAYTSNTTYRENSPTALFPGSPRLGSIERRGDYDVFTYTATSSLPAFFRILNTSFHCAEVMVFDSSGTLKGYATSYNSAGNAAVSFTPVAGRTYKVVVGAYDDESIGSYQVSVDQVGKSSAPTNSGSLIQTNAGVNGNFVTVGITSNGGLMQYTRNNDVTPSPWDAGVRLPAAPGPVAAISLIQTDFSTSGNGPGDLALVARVGDKLVFYSRPDNGPWQASGYMTADGATITGVSGQPALIQGRFGAGAGKHGNFELVVPLAQGGFAHFYRDNNAAGHPWRRTTPTPIGQSLGQVSSLSLVQSNYTGMGNGPGNLEVVARVGDKLAYFWRPDNDGWHQSQGFLSADGVTITGATGTPSMIQSRFGARGNFELAVPLASGGFATFWRDNDDQAAPWHGTAKVVIGQSAGVISDLSMIQSSFSSSGLGYGNLEVVARVGKKLVTFWRLDQPPHSWASGWDVATP